MSKKPAKKKAASKKPAGKAAKKAGAKPAKAAKKTTSKAGSPGKSAKSTVMRDRAIAHAKFARGTFNRYNAGFGDEHVVAQPTNIPNHLLWTLGHLASTASWLNGLVSGGPSLVPESYNTMFGMESKPVNDATAYPPMAEVKKAFEDSFDALIASVSKLDDAQLLEPPAQDGGGFVTDKLDALHKFAWHEGWHIGQLADLRRGLGITAKN